MSRDCICVVRRPVLVLSPFIFHNSVNALVLRVFCGQASTSSEVNGLTIRRSCLLSSSRTWFELAEAGVGEAVRKAAAAESEQFICADASSYTAHPNAEGWPYHCLYLLFSGGQPRIDSSGRICRGSL